MRAKISRGRRRARESCDERKCCRCCIAKQMLQERGCPLFDSRVIARLHNAKTFYLRRAKNVILLHHALRLYNDTKLIAGNKIVIGVIVPAFCIIHEASNLQSDLYVGNLKTTTKKKKKQVCRRTRDKFPICLTRASHDI